MLEAKDLKMVPPRSPKEKIAGFVILARALDKCRSEIAGTSGCYHFNCPVDQKLFEFAKIDAKEFKSFVSKGVSDEEVGKWVKEKSQKTDSDIEEWSDEMMNWSLLNHPEYSDWFRGVCRELGLDCEKTSEFDYLEADDKISFS